MYKLNSAQIDKCPHRTSAALRHIASMIGGGCVLALIFWLALSLACAIPDEWIQQNCRESADALTAEGLYPASYAESAQYDNFTVALMINEAMCSDSGNPFIAALSSMYYVDEQNQIGRLSECLGGAEGNSSYGRYWHGYLLFLKPLLIFLNVVQIRLVLQTALLIALGGAGVALAKSMGGAGVVAGIALLFSFGIMGIMDASAALPLFSSFFIAALGVIWATHCRLEYNRLAIGFFLLGSFTVFFDFLDNPILTLGIPLAVIALRKEDDRNVKQLLSIMALCCASWAFGYAFLWAMKWALATIVTGIDILGSAKEAASFRLGAGEQAALYNTSPTIALQANVSYLGLRKYIVLLAAVVAIAQLIILKATGSPNARNIAIAMLALALIAILPYLWYLVLSNHSTIHAWFTFRNQAITLFALLLACLMPISSIISCRKRPR